MDDLISRSAAIEALKEAMCMTGYQSRAIDAVRFLPSVETVEVIRCKSCVHFTACEEIEGFSWTGFCNYGDYHTDEGDFCSRGVRKEAAEE